MDLLTTWGTYWLATAAVLAVSGWFAKAGLALRAAPSWRGALRFAHDVLLVSAALVAGFAVLTEGKGCQAGAPNCAEKSCEDE